MRRAAAPSVIEVHHWICLINHLALSVDPTSWEEMEELIDFLHWYQEQQYQQEQPSIGLIEIPILQSLLALSRQR